MESQRASDLRQEGPNRYECSENFVKVRHSIPLSLSLTPSHLEDMAAFSLVEPKFILALTSNPNSQRCIIHTLYLKSTNTTLSLSPHSHENRQIDGHHVAASSIDISSPEDAGPVTTTDTTKGRQKVVRISWEKLVRRSRSWRSKAKTDVLEQTKKVVVLDGGSFGTAMAAHVAGRKAEMEVIMLVRDPQFSFCFLEGIAEYVDPALPFISLSKGLELNTLRMMSQVIPQALRNPRQPFVALLGPSFALEIMNNLPTDAGLQLVTSDVNSDVTGVEITSSQKNVLAIAAGIVEGMSLGNNSMASLVAQGCSEIRWLAKKMGAKSATLTGLSGTGDIMLTCFVSLSGNRTLGVRLGLGEELDGILSSMKQVAKGDATARAVISLAQKYNVKMPILTAVARIMDNELTPQEAVLELMRLPLERFEHCL